MDRNDTMQVVIVIMYASLSARRAWIEICCAGRTHNACKVALRKESVDRNTNPGSSSLTFPVALRKESVDRNLFWHVSPALSCWSLSARRAWIEIRRLTHHQLMYPVALRKESVDRNPAPKYHQILLRVALRKESVDRNTMRRDFKVLGLLSLSARRAWIEIAGFTGGLKVIIVALRKESVDRNKLRIKIKIAPIGRSPQGERG